MRGNQVTQRIQPASVAGLGKLRLSALSLFILAFLGFSAVPALGAETHALKATFGDFSNPSGVAIDEANGNVFVTELGEFGPADDSVQILGPEGGAPIGVAVPELEGFDFVSSADLAIDNSAVSPSKGALYVTDLGNEAVKKFTLNPVSEEYELKGTLNATPGFSDPLGVAVDAKGNVFVSDRPGGNFEGYIVEFSPAGVEIGRIFIPEEGPFTVTNALAFDSAGNLYAISHGGGGVYKFAANGSGDIEPNAARTRILAANPTGIAIGQDTDTLYVAAGKRVIQYSASCVPVEENCAPELDFGTGVLSATRRVAVSPINGDIYVVDGGKGDVAVYDRGLSVVADPATEAATEVKQTAASLNGVVSAAGGPAASCEFQYTTKASFEAEEFEGASSAPCSPAGPFIGTAANPVNADVSGLSGEAAYVFRLRASNENGPSFGEALSFSTVGLPKIEGSFVTQVSLDSASVEGLVNPNGGPNAAVGTTYAVEFVSQADFEASEYANATRIPLGGEAIGSGTEDVKVKQQLSGLSAFTTYHFRIVAENEAGEEQGTDKTFTTFIGQGAGLPDGRVYEQVTPVEKNGAAPTGGRSAVQASLDGGGITYVSGGVIPGGDGAQEYPAYLASRGADWTTQGLLPPANAGAVGRVLGWSEDLTQAYVTLASKSEAPVDFLQRESATHSMRTIATEGGEDPLISFIYVGAAEDSSTVVFESDTVLYPGGATKAFNTYAWNQVSGELSLVGVFNTGLVPTKGSLAGSNQTTEHTHYTQAQRTVSSDGSRVFFSDVASGQLYLRQNPTLPQSELDGGGHCTEAAMACTIQVSASQRAVPDPKGKNPAIFWSASTDGSKAFFTSPGKLTDDATTGPNDEGNDLYRYDVESEELTDLTPDAGDTAGAEVRGVLGTSDDGSYVYFAANGVLAAGATQGDCTLAGFGSAGNGACNLYLWHNGSVAFVARLRNDNANWSTRVSPEKTSRISPDGQTLLFGSREKLTVYDNGEVPELYLYRAPSAAVSCVSCSPTGQAPLGAATLRSIAQKTYVNPAPSLTRNLSVDGDRVFFETADKLVASDSNGIQDVYEWEAKGSGSCESEAQNGGCLYLLSSGTSPEPSYFGDAGANGDDAFIFTVQPLVGQDKDQIVDIYDARVGGGIASQNSPTPVPCEGEACKGPLSAPPATQSPGSAGFSGPGNQKKAKPHKKKRHHKKRKHRKERHASRKHR
jgi:sugar lactone lactonase YvrE